MKVTVGACKYTGVPVLTPAQRVEEGSIENHLVVFNLDHLCIKPMSVTGFDALEVEFVGHGGGKGG